MGMIASILSGRNHAPVVVVIATCGEERVKFLLERALPSVEKQISQIDRVVVVSDNDTENEPLSQDMIRSCFQGPDRDKVFLLPNTRTRHMSGTGAWNTGIVAAFNEYGKNCWVAILDDDDEWSDDHVRACLDASTKNGAKCKWVVSGIIRRRSNGKDHQEPIPAAKPCAQDFFVTNPGVQGSNLFVMCGALVEAGMFDERLPSTTDRDLCIRLADLLQVDTEAWFASTGKHTVIHHAGTHGRVSTRGSPAKIEGLKIFYYKHAPRMNPEQRAGFQRRAKERFGCNKSEFLSQGLDQPAAERETLRSWSSDELELNRNTKASLSLFNKETSDVKGKKNCIFGIISGNLQRLAPLLKDLGSASASPHSDFCAFVIVFANNADPLFAGSIREALTRQKLRGHVIEGTDGAFRDILSQCRSSHNADAIPLPICLSRTVLQVFIFCVARKLDGVNAVAILDDDKRLPMGWSPFCTDGDHEAADVQIGRDLRTPPNPAPLSLRTNLIDLIYAFDLENLQRDDTSHGQYEEVHELLKFCHTIDIFANKFDWYYDKSSSRSNHLETPVLSYGFDSTQDPPFACPQFLRTLLSKLLVGTPFARDVIPLEAGPTLQRGGCLVVIKKDESSFDVLAIEQDAPLIALEGGESIHSRRSDSFWCKEIKKSMSKVVAVNPHLYVYHDNSFDRVPTAPVMRRTMVQEVLGAVLCREKSTQRFFKDKALLELKLWLARVGGLLKTVRSRSYYSDEMELELIRPLEAIINESLWQQEVFDVVNRQFDKLEAFEPRPTDYTAPAIQIQIDGEMSEICFQWNIPKRIREAGDVLKAFCGSDSVFVGLGHEGVVFQIEEFAYKVIDQVKSQDLPHGAMLEKFSGVYVEGTRLPVIKSPFIRGGRLYRGGHGRAMLRFLKWMKDKGLGCSNVTPNNLIIDGKGSVTMLKLVDLGRDLFMAPASPSLAQAFKYEAAYKDMCRRAFLCYRFSSYADNKDGLKILKTWMRESSANDGNIPQLYGFDMFMEALNSLYETKPDHHRLFELLFAHGVNHPILVSARSDLRRSTGAISDEDVDSVVIESIRDLIAEAIETLVRSPSNVRKLAVCIEDPSSLNCQERRPLWFCRRHLKRLSTIFSFSISEEDVQGIDQAEIEAWIQYHVFLLSFDSRPVIKELSKSAGCHLMIKSCPMEHKTICADVRRIVRTLESASTFKSITLLADLSKSSGFLREYSICENEDLTAYIAAIKRIKEERLVDHVIEFRAKDGNDECAIGVNSRWFGREGCSATHSESRQQYASTLFGFDQLLKTEYYNRQDLVLHCDADIIFHCDPSLDGVKECISRFSADHHLLTFAFPILSTNPSTEMVYEHNGRPCRFEIRCSFVHLERLLLMLPLKVSDAQMSDVSDLYIKPGWWRILDDNIKQTQWKSCRGSLAGSNKWFFVHPQNQVKREEGPHRMLAIADRIANAVPTYGFSPSLRMESKGFRFAWREQQDSVDLVRRSEWLCERNEPYVIVAYGPDVSFGCALRFFDSIGNQIGNYEKGEVGLIFINDGPGDSLYEDTNDRIQQVAREAYGDTVSFLRIGMMMGLASIEHAVDSMCGRHTSVITFVRVEGYFLDRGGLSTVWECLSPSAQNKVTLPFDKAGMNAFWKCFSTINGHEASSVFYAHGGIAASSTHPSFTLPSLFEGSGLVVFRKDHFRAIKDLKEVRAIDATQLTDAGLLYFIEDRRIGDSCKATTTEYHRTNGTETCDECGALNGACSHNYIFCSHALAAEKVLADVAPCSHFPWRVASTKLPCTELTGPLEPWLKVSEEFSEGGLRIQIAALIQGEKIDEAEKVHVRIHSECLTGDVFHSKKCDCGEQKTRFIQSMDSCSHAVFLYIRGHEGRGAGLFNKINAYNTLDRRDSITHIEALEQEGCKSDVRRYDAAVCFLRFHLKVKFESIVLHTNNPEKIAAVENLYQDTAVTRMKMSTLPTKDNEKYLKEKIKLLGHEGLIDNEDIKDLKEVRAIDATQLTDAGLLYFIEDRRIEDSFKATTTEYHRTNGTETCDECGALNGACSHNYIFCSHALAAEKVLADVAPCSYFSWRVASTKLPCTVLTGPLEPWLKVSEEFSEGGLRIQIAALIQGEKIDEAEKVHVRIHSECFTGDVFHSKKCDCGEQKTRFIQSMDSCSHAVFLYIRGHEGRGAGLFNKINAYNTLDRRDSITHIEALEQEGCKSDVRRYDAAVCFLRFHLKVKFESIVLHTNNPEKIAAVETLYQDTAVTRMKMSTLPTKNNETYLKEKIKLLGHEGLIDNEEQNDN